MIDLEKLRAVAQSANTAEQWYAAHDMTSCSYDYDKAFIAACSPSVVLELLDHLAQLEKDAGRWRMLPAFLEDHQIDYVRLVCDIDTAMESNHG